MKKYKMSLFAGILLILSFVSVHSVDMDKPNSIGQGEMVDSIPFSKSSPVFRRVEKVEAIPPTSSKTETVDISPKLAAGDDEDIFWEVTKTPESRLQDGSTRTDFVDGNHPNLFEVITHDHVDKTTGHSGQSKRVKKILPPFGDSIDDVTKRNARNVSKQKIIAIKVSDIREMNQSGLKSNETGAPEGGFNLPGYTTEMGEATRGNNQMQAGTTGSSIKPEATSGATEVSEKVEATTTSTEVTRQMDTTLAVSSLSSQVASATPGTEGIERRKIQNPEFLIVPGRVEEEKVETVKDAEDGEEIKGIPLVPYEYEKSKRTTEKTIWQMLRKREETTSPRTLYGNFDADSAEVEYETENFQHGYSNIEKHELPFSYALPWLEIKDKRGKKEKEGKKVMHSKINDFPSILPMNTNYFRSGEEMEIPKDLSKLLRLSQSESSGVTMSIVDSGTNHEDTSRYGHRPSKWYLLLLTGNSTIVKLRRKDFTKYLKLNLAARLSVEYDDVKVNEVILSPPKVLVNISVYAPSEDVAEESQLDLREKFEDKGEAPLYKLAETNATLLELSGEEYHVVRFLSLRSQQPEAEAHSVPNTVSLAVHHDDVEFIVYTFIGRACACAVILVLFVSLGKYLRKVSEHRWPWSKAKSIAKPVHRVRPDPDEFNGISPAVIYSGGFPQIRGSWMSGVGSRVHPPNDTPVSNPSILKQYPGIEIGHRNTSLYPEIDTRTCSSPRHNKLQIYSAGANNLVLPIPPLKKATKADGDVHPLDVRISLGEEKLK